MKLILCLLGIVIGAPVLLYLILGDQVFTNANIVLGMVGVGAVLVLMGCLLTVKNILSFVLDFFLISVGACLLLLAAFAKPLGLFDSVEGQQLEQRIMQQPISAEHESGGKPRRNSEPTMTTAPRRNTAATRDPKNGEENDHIIKRDQQQSVDAFMSNSKTPEPAAREIQPRPDASAIPDETSIMNNKNNNNEPDPESAQSSSDADSASSANAITKPQQANTGLEVYAEEPATKIVE